ncbi:hypothetical protein CFC21_078141 [Triticum aestivum]|uniref:Uncharacterized protein n=2 Tax=Triticum aestivum TaxID=4565 RepID=A0A3B6MQP3_WHEAT|nr:hypothetical protein CFC21_078141 [Triticum aestivum]
MSTPACKDGPILDHPNGRRAKSKRGHTDDFIEPFSPEERVAICTCAFGITFVICLCLLIVLCVGAAGGTANVSQRPGDLFVRLVGTRGLLDPRGSPPTSPAFRLALDFDRTPPTYRSCSGGGNSWLRISYHDMILAWAQVPHFCVYGNRGVGSVGTLEVEAKADASVLREEVEGPIANSRCSNQAEEFGHDEISEGRC